VKNLINSLTISNFQSHKQTHLEFENGINIIVGQSDSGKSAVIKALNWVVNNTPSGEAFRSSWGGDTKVQVHTDDKDIQRYKGKKGNLYLTCPEDTTYASKFNSFGQDVPNEIKQLLNFSSLNLQGQFDSPFLLALSGGEVARYLNKIAHLDSIDKSLSNINRILRKEKEELSYLKKDLTETREKVGAYEWIDEAEGCLSKLEVFETSLRQKKDKSIILAETINRVERWEDEIQEISKLTQYEDKVIKLIKDSELIEKNKHKVERLNEVVENIETMEEKINRYKCIVADSQKDFNDLMPDVCPLCGRG